jgi:formate hydrogenlyase transcriptional activator
MPDTLSPHAEIETPDRQNALLQVAERIATHRDLPALFRDLAERLPAVAPFDFIGLVLHDPAKHVMRVHVLETAAAHRLTRRLDGMQIPIDDSASGWVWTHQRPLIVPTLAEETRYPIGMTALRDIGVQSVCLFPLTTAMRRLGAIGFGSLKPFAFSDADVEFLNRVARMVAVAVDNVLHHQDVTHQRDRLRLLLQVTESIASHRDLNVLLQDLAARLPEIVPFDFINAVLHDPERQVMRLWMLVTSVPSTIKPGLETPVEQSPGGLVWKTQEPLTVDDVTKEERFPQLMALFRENGVRSFCVVPLTTAQRRLGAMGFGSLQPRAYQESEIAFMQQVAKQVAVALDNALNSNTALSYQGQLTRERDRQRLLLEINNAVVSHLDLDDLFTAVSECLRKVIQHDGSSLLLCDAATGEWRIRVLDFANNESFVEQGRVESVSWSPSCVAIETGKPAVFAKKDLEDKAAVSEIARHLLTRGVLSYCSIPLLAHHRTTGALNLGRRRDSGFTPEEVELLSQVAHQITIAVENALNYEQAQKARRELARERDRSNLLLDINNAVVSHLELRDVFASITLSLRRVMKADVVSLTLLDPETNQLRLYALDFPGRKGFIEEGTSCMLCGCPSSTAISQREPVLLGREDLERSESTVSKRLVAEGVTSACCVPLLLRDRTLGALNIGSLQEGAFTAADAELLAEVAKQIALAVANSIAYQEIASLKDKLAKEKVYLQEEIQSAYNFEEVIGDSRALKHVLKEVQTVAATDSTVLILGETGSGKELIARALHNLSNRRDRTFVKLNCAAIPTGLLESELFGHEKGAFTGAIATKIGRFELADGGTIFLDEVGEIPLELQVKLLRVLQEQEFERLGSTRTIRVNVRVVAATNRDLGQMVEEQRFRSDLYYRLKVFPITVPPLRDRAEDIPLLVRHFAQKFATRMKKAIDSVPTEAMKALQAYPWPGNVRELENFIERAVILSSGSNLFVPLAELKRPNHAANGSVATLEEAEREHILKALRDTNWVIGGAAGAAARLGMKRTTLQSKMQKLGIARPS